MSKTKKLLNNEIKRKLVHIAHTMLIAFIVLGFDYTMIIIVEILFLISVTVVRKKGWFRQLQDVERVSYGEFFMPLAFIFLAIIDINQWVFLAAILHLALADVAAAIVGISFGKVQYGILGLRKTLAGTSAFIVFSICIGVWVALNSSLTVTLAWPATILFVTLASTISENISPLGSDNLTIPLSVSLVLSLLT